MKGQEGGPLELVGAYGWIIFGLLVLVVIILVAMTFFAEHPEYGISIPPLFGGG